MKAEVVFTLKVLEYVNTDSSGSSIEEDTCPH